jgi:hypothetical protein
LGKSIPTAVKTITKSLPWSVRHIHCRGAQLINVVPFFPIFFPTLLISPRFSFPRTQHQSSYRKMPSPKRPTLPDEPAESLLDAREARRRAEQDEQLLANRIALLRQEEAKAWKKIKQTKERAEKILDTREENKTRVAKQRRDARLAKDNETKRLRRKKQTRQDHSRRLGDAEIESKREKVNEIKREKRALQQAKARRTQEMQSMARQRVGEMRRKKAEVSERQRRVMQSKVEKSKEDYNRRVEEEEKALRKREKDVRKMEKRERELIERLKRTQMVQSEAYAQLEQTLNGGSPGR